MNDLPTRYSNEKFRALFELQGRRQDWFADQLGKQVRGRPFHYSYISKLLSGDKPLTEDIAITAAAILQVPVDWLRDESTVAIVTDEAVPA